MDIDTGNKITGLLSSRRHGASACDIAKSIGKNRITVTKYLEVMRAQGIIYFEGVGPAKLWHLADDRKPAILIVDDESYVVNLIALSLLPGKYSILKAFSGPEAIAEARLRRPGCIILDLMMPGMSGFEVLLKLRACQETKDTPVLVLSAKGGMDDKTRSIKLGADDYMTKPFDPMELEARVERLLSRGSEINDITHLPGIAATEKELGRRNSQKKLRVFLQGFEKYKESNGVRKSNEALILLSRLLSDMVQAKKGAFLGHCKEGFIIAADSEVISRKELERLNPYIGKDSKLKIKIEACD